MKTSYSAGAAALPASAAAGPLFLTILAAITLYGRLPQPIVLSGGELAGFVVALPFAAIFGFPIAYLPNVAGTKLMAAISDNSAVAREPSVWMCAGGALIAVVIFGLDPQIEAPVGLSLILTSAICARICRACYAGPSPAQV
jgi:hypothetical protein